MTDAIPRIGNEKEASYRTAPHNIEVEDYLKSMGKKIIQVVYNPRTSSTKIKQKVIAQFHKGRDIETAII